MNTLKEKLINTALAKGICADGYNEMRNRDGDALVDYYTANLDWCLERDFPDLATLGHWAAIYPGHGVFVGKTFHGELLNDLQTYIFHDCKGTIKVGLNVDKAIIPMLYLANGCRLRIIGVGNITPKAPSEVPVYVFGKNDYSARDNKYVEFNIFKHKLL